MYGVRAPPDPPLAHLCRADGLGRRERLRCPRVAAADGARGGRLRWHRRPVTAEDHVLPPHRGSRVHRQEAKEGRDGEQPRPASCTRHVAAAQLETCNLCCLLFFGSSRLVVVVVWLMQYNYQSQHCPVCSRYSPPPQGTVATPGPKAHVCLRLPVEGPEALTVRFCKSHWSASLTPPSSSILYTDKQHLKQAARPCRAQEQQQEPSPCFQFSKTRSEATYRPWTGW